MAQAAQIYGDMIKTSEAAPQGWGNTSGGVWTEWPYDAEISQGNSPPTYGGPWTAFTAWGVLYQTTTGNASTNTRVNIVNMQSWWLQTSTHTWHQIQLIGTSNPLTGAAYWEDFHDDTGHENRIGRHAQRHCRHGHDVRRKELHFYPSNRGTFIPSDYGGMFSLFSVRLILANPSLTDDRATSQYCVTCGADYWPNLTSGLPSGYDPLGNGANPGIGGSCYIRVTNNWRTICMTSCALSVLQTYPPPIDLTGLSA
jgi:hypothetical protein